VVTRCGLDAGTAEATVVGRAESARTEAAAGLGPTELSGPEDGLATGVSAGAPALPGLAGLAGLAAPCATSGGAAADREAGSDRGARVAAAPDPAGWFLYGPAGPQPARSAHAAMKESTRTFGRRASAVSRTEAARGRAPGP